jgi:hypothetical protein
MPYFPLYPIFPQSIYDLNNYRGITLTSNVYKIYASIMENTIMAFLEDTNVLGESQGAFRKNRRPDLYDPKITLFSTLL